MATSPARFSSKHVRQRKYLNGTSDGPFTTSVIQSQFDTNSFSGSGSVVGYKRKIAKGQDATSDASGIRYLIEAGPVDFDMVTVRRNTTTGALLDRWEDSFHGHPFNNVPTPLNTVFVPTASADREARLKFLSKYRDARTTFHSGTFFGELREAISMLRRPAQSLRQGVDGYVARAKKRVRGLRPRTASRVVGETWLEYSFGWMPFINDIRDAAKLLEAQPSACWEEISAKHTIPFSSEDVVTGPYGIGFLSFYTKYRKIGEVTVRYKGAARMDINTYPSFSEQMGFTPSEFVPTVWNLIPYSFLVDYFSNIGRVIDGMSLGTVNLAWGVRTAREVARIENVRCEIIKQNVVPGQTYQYPSDRTSSYKAERVSFSRNKVTSVSVGVTDIRLRVPGVDSPWKWLNIAALAASRSL